MHAFAKSALATALSAAALLSSTSALAQAAQPAAASAVAFSQKLLAAASAFETYTSRAGAIRADFADGASVSEALQSASAYEPAQIQQGEIAYAAVVALQDPEFVDGARRWARSPQAAVDLMRDPSVITRMPAAASAAARVSAALRERGAMVLAAGTQAKQAAYDIQHQPWSLKLVADPSGVLARSKALSQAAFSPAPEDTARLVRTAASSGAGGDPSALSMPVVQRGLALAALAVMGQAGDGDELQLAHVLSSERSNDCMRMSKLNLYQCLAVAGPQYEDVFCLGQHALMDTGQCVIADAAPRASQSIRIASRAEWAPPAASGSLIPVASVTMPVAAAAPAAEPPVVTPPAPAASASFMAPQP